MRRACGLSVAFLLLGVAACRRAAPAGLAFDFAQAAAAADREGPRQVILFGTPGAMPHQVEGFVLPAEPQFAERFAWGRRQVDVRIDWASAMPRRALVDLAPYPGIEGQAAEVFLNESRVGRVEVGRARRRHLLDLPAAAQRRENTLRFVFGERSERVEGYGRRLAAAFHNLIIAEAGDTALLALADAGAPPPLSVRVAEGVPSLIQGGPGALGYVLRLPSRAELRFSPGAHVSSARATLRIVLQAGAQAPVELWRGEFGPGESGAPVSLPVPGSPGSLARLTFRVEAEAGTAPVWGVWDAPRLLGDTPTAALPAPVPRAQDDRAADGLRQELAGSNVLLVIFDAAGAKHFGCYGYPRATTPETDRIAADAVLFERAYSPAVYTLAAMSSLWTSQYADEHQNVDLRNASLDRVRLTLAELLTARGVETAGFVANGMAGPGFSFDRGFSEFQEVYGAAGSRAESFRPVLPAWLGARKQRRFFAYVHYREPHAPYDPPAPFDTLFGPDAPLPRELRSDTRRLMALHNEGELSPAALEHVVRLYDGNLAYADRELGFLRRALEADGLWDRTLLIVAADHGEALLEHGWIGHNAQLYEESVRIPLIMRLPSGKGPRGVRVAGLVDLVDMAPTIADIFGLRGTGGSDREFRGRSLLSLVVGGAGKSAVTMRSSGERPRYALRDERFKLIHDSATGRDELYDLLADPEERNDRAAADPLRTAFYRQSLHAWLLSIERTAAGVEGTTLSAKQLENLRALGYIQ